MIAFADENRLISPRATSTVAALRDSARQRFGSWSGESVAFNTDDPLARVAAVTAAATVGFELAIMPDERFTDEWQRRLTAEVSRIAAERNGQMDERPGAVLASRRDGFLVFTSGSTGQPRAVRHTLETLHTFEHTAPGRKRWLVTYLPGTYAWFQMVMLGLLVPEQELVLPASLELHDLVSALLEYEATAVSGTPTFWRYVLAAAAADRLRALPLRQVTLGGERVEQALLDELTAVLPQARITHIFATTETGPALAVSDGLAGFPASYLERPLLGGRVRLRLHAGTLWVRSAYSHLDADEWVDTGDLAEVVGERVVVRGRRDVDVINVGGYKVSRVELEEFVRTLPGVRWARAYAVPAPLTGNLVGLDVVVDPGTWNSAELAEAAVVQACRERFPEPAVPRFVAVLAHVPMQETLKAPA